MAHTIDSGIEDQLARTQRELSQAHALQAATAEILRVISNSPGDLETTLGVIAKSAAQLLDVTDAEITRIEGDVLRLMAKYGLLPQRPLGSVRPISRGLVIGRAVADRNNVHVVDLQAAESEFPEGAASARKYGHRTTLATPLLSKGIAIGAILIRRMEVKPFTDNQIALLRTFADQAVIAIQNAQLFDEVQARTRELSESLEQQVATGDILRIVASSPTDAQPVFDNIARSAARLCNARFCHVYRYDGELVHFEAQHGLPAAGVEAVRRAYPIPPGRASAAARAILNGAIEQIPDVQADPDYKHREITQLMSYHSIVAVPMLKDGRPIGAISLGRSERGYFPERQVDLLRTFADQAVIAIE
ncbi:MAG TPA: GAF domain-containing protein, partial [Lacipirellulaceae bacterium]|nr:GAF domain-containing protein [Lacipirellulaceae bacterium]